MREIKYFKYFKYFDKKMILGQIIIINRSLEMREMRSKRKGAKVSISSVVTEMTQFSEEVLKIFI